jgi:cbb3-type cytochrome oxidase cytochrome c subunit
MNSHVSHNYALSAAASSKTMAASGRMQGRNWQRLHLRQPKSVVKEKVARKQLQQQLPSLGLTAQLAATVSRKLRHTSATMT